MKTIKFLSTSIIALMLSVSVSAQDHSQHQMAKDKTESFKVAGNCSMCKDRIEKAAKIEGVSKAEWDSEKHLLTVTYNPAKVKVEDLQKKVAAVGHDTEKFKSDDKIYDKLPGCCKYERLKY